MTLTFTEQDHKYVTPEEPGKEWLSVTTLIGALKEGFNKEQQAAKSSRNTKSKWYGLPPAEILQAWDNENKRATELGSWYHKMRENELYIRQDGITIVETPVEQGVKKALSQKLTDGIYPEHIVYLESAGICGQIDRPEVVNSVVNITDYKTNKEIKRVGFTNWEGITKKMLGPLKHLDDCELTHYTIQLSLYMYMILRHNPSLIPGKLTIEHVTFEIESEDKYGYPIYKKNEYDDPIIKNVETIEVPYLASDVKKLIEWVKIPANRSTLKKKH